MRIDLVETVMYVIFECHQGEYGETIYTNGDFWVVMCQ
jgi:hypothetical protein